MNKETLAREKLDKLKIKYDHLEFIQNPADCPVVDNIWNGEKTVEGRTNKVGKSGVKRSEYKVGSILAFVNQADFSIMLCVVLATRTYETLKEYVHAEGYKNVIPIAKNEDEAINWYRTGTPNPDADTKNAWSSEDDIKKYGMVGIEIKPICKFP